MTMTTDFSQTPLMKRANEMKRINMYPFFRAISESESTKVTINGEKQVMIGSNNYLGLTHHPLVKEAAQKAIEKYGTGCTGSRFLNGNLELHEELEERLARYIGHEKALVFSTGMQVNLGSIPSVTGPRDCILQDMENHASLIDAARLSMATKYNFKHNNMEELENLLETHRSKYRNVLIITDGVFSMTGDVCKLPEIVKLANKYDAMIYLDDAHGLGVLGSHGRGTMNHFGLTDQVDLNMGTFSKSFASIGGFVSGRSDVIDYIKHSARAFMFTAALPPSAVATALACLNLVEEDESFVTTLWEKVAFMRKGFADLGFYTYESKTPIIPVFVGDEFKAMQLAMVLQENGIFATPVLPPAVPKGEALIRTSYMGTHSYEELQYCLDVFAKLAPEFGLSQKQ